MAKRPPKGKLIDREGRSLSPYHRKGKRRYLYESGEGDTPMLSEKNTGRKPRGTRHDTAFKIARSR